MSEMKDSCIKWIGEIPKEWSISKTKYIFQVISGSTPNSEYLDYWDGTINWITPADMNDVGYIASGERCITERGYKSCGTTIVPAKSIIISNRAPIGKINIALDKLCTNQGCKCLVNEKYNSNSYYYYYYIANKEQLVKLGKGTTFKELSTTDLQNFEVIILPMQEQQLIANFLDIKIRQLDTVLENISKQIDILNQYKMSLITETVTKGLNSEVKMKDSKIDWIGKIPKHWDIYYLKHLFKMFAGGDIDEDDFSEGYSDFTPYPIYSNSLENDGLFGYMSKYRFSGNTFTVTGRGDVGKAIARNNKFYPIVRLLVCVPMFEDDTRYYTYCVNSADLLGDQTTMAQLTTQKLGTNKFPRPPIDEQKKIADYLDKKCEEIDDLIKNKQEQIEKIEQYKKSLIYEYVTGKKRVKGAEELYG